MTELLGFSFLRPWWLPVLIPAAVLLVLLYWHGWRHSAWEKLLPRALQSWLLQRYSGGGHKKRFAALGITWALAILALAGPALQTTSELQRVDDNALVIVLDLSRNMLSNDIPPDRLEQARFKIRTLMQDYADSQLSLIVYAGSAHRVTPLSRDNATLTNLLSTLDPGIMPVDGQAVGSALTLARQAIQQYPRDTSHILLLTSGLDADGQQQLAEHAAALGSQLSILGVGTRSGAPVPLPEGGFLRDDQGRILLPRLNSQQLMTLARQHGARYHNITVGERDLNYLLQPLQSTTRAVASEHLTLADQGHWLVLLLLPIAALGARRGWLGLLLCAALLPTDAQAFGWDDLWQRADQQAVQLLRDQRPAEAAERFSDPDWRSWALYQAGEYQKSADAWSALAKSEPDEPRHHFNRGTALVMAGHYQAALEAYEHTLTLAPEHHGARHNRKAVEDYLERLREQQQEPQAPSDAPGETEAHNGSSDSGSNQTHSSSLPTPPTPEAEDAEQDSDNPGATSDPAAASNNGESAPLPSVAQPHPEGAASNSQTPSRNQPHSALERQQSLEQWLLEIPDNPAELLRRKFLYQHLQQQDASP